MPEEEEKMEKKDENTPEKKEKKPAKKKIAEQLIEFIDTAAESEESGIGTKTFNDTVKGYLKRIKNRSERERIQLNLKLKEKEVNRERKTATDEYFKENNIRIGKDYKFVLESDSPDKDDKWIAVYQVLDNGKIKLWDDRIGGYQAGGVSLGYFKSKIIGENYKQKEIGKKEESKIENEGSKEYLDSILKWIKTNKQDIFDKIFAGIKSGEIKEGHVGGNLKHYYREYDEGKLDEEGRKVIMEELRKIEDVIPSYIAVLDILRNSGNKDTDGGASDDIKKVETGKEPGPDEAEKMENITAPEIVGNNGSDQEKIAAPDVSTFVREAQERGEKIEYWRLEVEKRRKDYLEADFQKKNSFKRIGGFFGKMFKNKEERNLENDYELAWFRANYDDALLEYKDALLEDAKLQNASDKELMDIAKIFQVEANSNIADGSFKVKIEHQEGKFSGFIKEHSLSLFERYKKLSPVTKIAAGAAFGLSALGAGYLGGATAEVVGSAVLARKAFLSFVTGVSTYLAAKNISGGKEEIGMRK
jgi:hypothetical protein